MIRFKATFLLSLLTYGLCAQAKELRVQFLTGSEVMVIAHRGDWRNAPENSLLALQNAIDMGVDIVEIDLKKTKDDQLVLMHDRTLDRTTTGKGLVADHTLGQIKSLYLRDGAGHKTAFRVPTLQEALDLCRGKVLINLDKAFEYFDRVYPMLKKTHTVDQIILKGYNKTYHQVSQKLGPYMDSIIYMPIIKLGGDQYQHLLSDLEGRNYKAVEFTFEVDTFGIINQFREITASGTRVWVNSLYPEHNAGHHDDLALSDPDGSYGWLIRRGVNLIQSDRPRLLLDYLRTRRGHHKTE